MGVAVGEKWEPFTTIEDTAAFQTFLNNTPFFASRSRRLTDTKVSVPAITFSSEREISTQMAFGKILDDLSKGDSELATRIVTTSPDVTGTTNLGPWCGATLLVNMRDIEPRKEDDGFDGAFLSP